MVPFHGDEAIHLYKAQAYVVYFVFGQPQRLQVDPPVAIDSEPYLRLIDGTLSAYLTGFILWHSGAERLENWTPAWYFGQDVAQNRVAGRYPATKVLHWGRLASALLTAACLWLMAVLGARLSNWRAGLAAALLLALHPVILLNGRRVMQEGALMCCTLLLVWFSLRYVENPTLLKAFLAGIAGGLALASKPTALLVVIAMSLSFIVVGVDLRLNPFPRKRGRGAVSLPPSLAGEGWGGGLQSHRSNFVGLIIFLLVTLLIYLVLTPAIWSNPPARILLAARLRSQILAGQTRTSPDAYDHGWQKWTALLSQPFPSQVQTYEAPDFAHDVGIAGEIDRYKRSPWRGIKLPFWIGLPLALLGLGSLLNNALHHHSAAQIVLIWFVLTSLAIGLAVPLAWQRYYLPYTLIVILMAGLGLDILGRALQAYGLGFVRHARSL